MSDFSLADQLVQDYLNGSKANGTKDLRRGNQASGNKPILEIMPKVESTRELQESEIALLSLPSANKSSPLSVVHKLRARHHEIARRLACGQTAIEVSRQMGVTPGWLSLMINKSEAFQELLSHYQTERDANALDFKAKIETVAGMALERLEDTLADDGAELSPKFLLDATQAMLDRAGYGPVQKRELRATSLNLSPEDIKRIRDEAIEAEWIPIESNSAEPALD